MDMVSAIVLGAALYGGKQRCPLAEFIGVVPMDEVLEFEFESIE